MFIGYPETEIKPACHLFTEERKLPVFPEGAQYEPIPTLHATGHLGGSASEHLKVRPPGED